MSENRFTRTGGEGTGPGRTGACKTIGAFLTNERRTHRLRARVGVNAFTISRTASLNTTPIAACKIRLRNSKSTKKRRLPGPAVVGRELHTGCSGSGSGAVLVFDCLTRPGRLERDAAGEVLSKWPGSRSSDPTASGARRGAEHGPRHTTVENADIWRHPPLRSNQLFGRCTERFAFLHVWASEAGLRQFFGPGRPQRREI